MRELHDDGQRRLVIARHIEVSMEPALDGRILASGAWGSQRDLQQAALALLYSVNRICVGSKRHVRSIRQEEIFISDGRGLRRS